MQGSTVNERPEISVIMPVRNEGGFIARSLGAVLSQNNLERPPQVILVDGESDDDTVEVALETATDAGKPIAIINNPERTAPSALNLGLANAIGRVVVRVDGHCEIPPDYLSSCLDLLQSIPAACVGGVCTPDPRTPMGQAIATAMSSPIGMGGVAFRSATGNPGPVDTLAFGAYRREVFDQIGGFDEELVRNQDDEFNFRLIQAGGTIWMDPSLKITYWSRESLKDLFRQFRGYGTYKVRLFQKRGAVPKGRHLAPLGLVLALLTSGCIAVERRRPSIFLGVAGGYILVVATAARRLGGASTQSARIGAAILTMHLAYGVGSLEGVWRWRHHFTDPPVAAVPVHLGWVADQESHG